MDEAPNPPNPVFDVLPPPPNRELCPVFELPNNPDPPVLLVLPKSPPED